MLIPSHRHRQEDLALWAELEEADRVNGESRRLAEKIQVALHTIAAFAADGPSYASISWGKDSAALAWLVWMSRLPIWLVSIRTTPYDNPYTSLVRDAFLARFDVSYCEFLVPSHVDAPFYGAFKLAGSRHISGIRASESGGRKIRMRRHGLASANACAPLGWWSSADVFALLAREDLPTHPNYAMLGGGRWKREQLRVDELGGEGGSQFGRREHEHEYFGDVLRRLESDPST